MDAHQIRQQGRRRWLQRKRKQYGEDFRADEDDGTGGSSSDFIVFGYSARLFKRSEDSKKLGMIPLGTATNAPVLVDRYDIRHLLGPGSMQLPRNARDDTDKSTLSDPRLNALRYESLGSVENEQAIFHMELEERRAYIHQLAMPKTAEAPETATPSTSAIALQYDQEGNPVQPLPAGDNARKGESKDEEDGALFVPDFAVPDGIVAPATRRLFGIIEHTAKFVGSQPADKANQMEIVIQGKQGNNPDFEFLSQSSKLFQFYKHLRWLVQTGLYGYADSDDGSGSDAESEHGAGFQQEKQAEKAEEKGEEEEAACHAEKTEPVRIPKEIAIPPKDVRKIVDKVASLIAGSANPQKLETKLRIEKATSSATYAFLSPFDQFNKYFCFRRDCFINGIEIVDDALPQEGEQQPASSSEPEEMQESKAEDIHAKRRRLALEFLKKKRKD
ncbi:hypothetical protein GGI12_004223 [Dipsacomyces acuminosporus]|nr:hypothetical protein GGI12_004223 [Dipsacomyces acuminosporus]